MKDEAIELARSVREKGRAVQINVLREYLQGAILRSLDRESAFDHVAFMGGTALRFLYGAPRFSEGLDLAVAPASFGRYSMDVDLVLNGVRPGAMEHWIAQAAKDLAGDGFEVSYSTNSKATVHRGALRFAGLLNAAGLSRLPEEKVEVMVELDTRPPAGAGFRVAEVRRPVPFKARFHDLPSLMAGKIAALTLRKFVKARDWYDFVFYGSFLKRGIEPNLTLLQNAIRQDAGAEWPAEQWRDRLRDKVLSPSFPASQDAEIRPYLDGVSPIPSLTKDAFLRLIDDARNREEVDGITP